MQERRRVGRRAFIAGSLAGAAGVVAGASIDGTAASLAGPVPAQRAATGDPVVVNVELGRVIGALPPRMLGFSMERARLFQSLLSPDNEPMVALLRLLGPGVLRLGGNSVEEVGWSPAGAGLTPGVVSPADLDRLAAFAEAVDWNILYGTPFVTGTAASVADEARVVAERLGSRLIGFELANEPDLYFLNPSAAAFDTFDTFSVRWEEFASAISGVVPSPRFAGPAAANIRVFPGWPQWFADRESDRASIITQHYYRGGGSNPGSINQLLTFDDRLDEALALQQSTAADHGMATWLDETNSYANGGQPGVSNTLASALWVQQLFFTAAHRGCEVVNIHNSGAGPGYAAIAQLNGVVTEIRPLFYGMLSIARSGSGSLVSSSTTSRDGSLRSYAVLRSPTSLAVVLVNIADQDVDVQVDCGRIVRGAVASTVIGPAIDATSGVTFRDAAVGIDGSWSPSDPVAQSFSAASVTTTVPPTSVTLVEVSVDPPAPTDESTTTTTAAPPSTSVPPAQAVAASPSFTG